MIKIYLLIIALMTNCLNRYPFDRYQKFSNYYSGENFKKDSIYKLKIGKTTKKDVINEFGSIYANHLTLDPELKRKYKNNYYLVAYLINYGYADSIVDKGQFYESREIRENIQLTLFFDKAEILLFYYVRQNGGKMELHNLEPDETTARIWPGIDCDFKYYESVSNPIVGWRLGKNAEKYDTTLICDWEKYIEK